MRRRYKSRLLALLLAQLLVMSPQWVMAAPIWSDAAPAAAQARLGNDPYRAARRVSADMETLKSVLGSAPSSSLQYMGKSISQAQQIELPMPDGSSRSFYIVESPVMEHGLARLYPEIQTFKVRAVTDQAVSGRVDIGPNGFHAYIHTPGGVVLIDPLRTAARDQYYSYYKHDYASHQPRSFSCGTLPGSAASSPVEEFKYQAKTSDELLTYRIAVAATSDYSAAVDTNGPVDVATVMAEVTTAINRVNAIYQRDLAISLELVGNNNLVIYTDPASDPYINLGAEALLDENQDVLDAEIGAANYDIGHVFNTTGGGLAAFGVVCDDSAKARGETGSSSPTGDPFYIDFVAHEIGHQFGADHTFNGTTDSCGGGGNRWSATAFEPGSGTTIMAYAGICGTENVEDYADATFHAGSIEQIVAYSRPGGAGNSCARTTSPTGNTAPDANAGGDYTIPARTPFTLTGIVTPDPESDTLTYQWDQMDAGTATNASTYGTDLGSNALFRSFEPSGNPGRTFPRMINLLAGVRDKAETLPTTSRNLNFRLTVRDGNGGVDEDNALLTVSAGAGPFVVLQPNCTVTLDTTQTHVIEWDTANTEQAPVNCATVDILLSTDSGINFTTLKAGTANDGAESVTIPFTSNANARIKIACVGNIFFDVSNKDFSLAQDGSGDRLISTGGSASVCNDINSLDQEPNNTPATAANVTLPATITGIVNSATDDDDYYVFTAGSQDYIFTLSGYGVNDLDLILYDSSGTTIVRESVSESDPTETINVGLANGQTYYIVVNAWYTGGLDSDYTLTVVGTTPAALAGGGGGMISFWLMLVVLGVLLARLASGRYRIILLGDTR